MLLNWLNAREATEVGTALADDFVLQTASASSNGHRADAGSRAPALQLQNFLGRFLQAVDRKARPLQLNLFKRAKLANSFKWRLLEKGVERAIVEELTRALVLRLSTGQAASPSPVSAPAARSRTLARNAETLLIKGNDFVTRGAYEDAVSCFRQFLELNPRHAVACNNLGVALIRLGNYEDAEAQFRRAIGIKESYADAQCNLGTLLRSTGRVLEAEMPLRRALKLKPNYLEAQISLGFNLLVLDRLSDARAVLERALKTAPRNVDALTAMGEVVTREGRFAEAEALYRRALEADPKAGGAWVGLAGLRKMTSGDSDWLKGAEGSLVSGLAPVGEAAIRFAIGKYYDDTQQFPRAFRSYERANTLWRVAARPYYREARKQLIDDLIRVYTREALSGAKTGASSSTLPVFVVGMPRAGTSLVEQIIASHPSARGAGELQFWAVAFRKHEAALRQKPPDTALSRRLAEEYLRVLERHRADAIRVVDKSPFNFDYLGLFHCVFPNARMIYVRRDPIDVCLSCYFQPFAPNLNFTMDLSDLAHYYREHVRMMAHWRAVLPSGTLLEIPYEQLVADQEAWTRKILEFLELDWDERCLQFHETVRPVGTASVWQVRQRIYQSSVGRWRNYEKFIGPLLELKNVGP
jgi:tetratricopeptide (TPR) repeat protein